MKGDLVVLVPDRNTEAAIDGLLTRRQSLKIRSVTARILVHPEKDPGCRLHGYELLRIHQRHYQFALMLFDREGCGAESQTRIELESQAESRLAEVGWKGRSGVVVIDPESPSPLVWRIRLRGVFGVSAICLPISGHPSGSSYLKGASNLQIRGLTFSQLLRVQ